MGSRQEKTWKNKQDFKLPWEKFDPATKRQTKVVEKTMINWLAIPKECEVCDGQFMIGGPMWSGDIHNTTFV